MSSQDPARPRRNGPWLGKVSDRLDRAPSRLPYRPGGHPPSTTDVLVAPDVGLISEESTNILRSTVCGMVGKRPVNARAAASTPGGVAHVSPGERCRIGPRPSTVRV